MGDNDPNPSQQKLIDSLDGTYLVDAGPGTGKTFTIARRYANLLISKEDIKPKDILLITFTRSGAENMRERIINECDQEASVLRNAPISTFHSHCFKLLKKYGLNAPRFLGIEETIPPSITILENVAREEMEFGHFMEMFVKKINNVENTDDRGDTNDVENTDDRGNSGKFNDLIRIMTNRTSLLDIIKTLGAKGIMPTRDGWYQNSESDLEGNYEEFRKVFEKLNSKVMGKRGSEIKNKLMGKCSNYTDKCFLDDTFGGHGPFTANNKRVRPELVEEIFNEERKVLKQFIHDVYFEYLKYCLGRNYLNFSAVMMFAFVMLCEMDRGESADARFKYIMVDEFQDTNAIQFKLILLLSKGGNICVVGDWKQSIFSFQHADVDNITEFKGRLKNHIDTLKRAGTGLDFSVKNVEIIKLDKNYRSTQEIIDFSEGALVTPMTKDEKLDVDDIKQNITPLESGSGSVLGEIKGLLHPDKHECILIKISEIINNPEYLIGQKGKEREIEPRDIAVLVRTKGFGRELLKKARKNNLPASLQGGLDIFYTPASLLLLAWLRILENRHSKRGWAVVLEEAGYLLEEIKHIFLKNKYPDDMEDFRGKLKAVKDIGTRAGMVFDKYGFAGAEEEKIIQVLQSNFDQSYMNSGEMVNFILENINRDLTYEVDCGQGKNVFTIRTMHSAKGLEYPVIFLPDQKAKGGKSEELYYDPMLGLRQKKIFQTNAQGYSHSFDNQKGYFLQKCLLKDQDEERRLRYVAMTRAKNYLYLTSTQSRETTFFKNIMKKPEVVQGEFSEHNPMEVVVKSLVAEPAREHTVNAISPHYLIDDSIFEKKEGERKGTRGKGMEYGTLTHRFAEIYVDNRNQVPENDDQKNIKELIDGLKGDLYAERECFLPLLLDGQKVMFKGVIDLLCIDDKTKNILVIDYKTDRNRDAQREYQKQLSVYYHVVKNTHPGHEVNIELFYTGDGDRAKINPLPLKNITKMVKEKLKLK